MSNMFKSVLASGGSGNDIPLAVICDSAFAGTTITCSDGTTTLTNTCPSTSPYEITFRLPNAGTWTVSGVVFGVTVSESILIQNPEVELKAVESVAIDVYSASNDTISYTGIDGQTHTITTNSNGYASTNILVVKTNGSSLTFNSSVAKDTSDITSDYSKTVLVTTNTTSIYIMPDGAIYWYGFYKELMTSVAALASGSSSIRRAPTITNNTNNVVAALQLPSNASYGGSYLTSTSIDVTNYNSLKVYTASANGRGGTYGSQGYSSGMSAVVTNSNANNYTKLNQSTILEDTGTGSKSVSEKVTSVDLTSISNAVYLGISMYGFAVSTGTHNAIWLE